MERSGRRRYRDSIICLVMSLAVLVLVLPLPARGQVGSTPLEGIVDDLSGARIARASVSLLNPDNGFHAEAVTDGEGRFSFPIIAPGATLLRHLRRAWPRPLSQDWNSTSAARCNCSSVCGPPDTQRTSRSSLRPRYSIPIAEKFPKLLTNEPSPTCRSTDAVTPTSRCYRPA